MNKLKIKLSKDYKTFKKGFNYEFDGKLIIISGINGSGKSQLLDIIKGTYYTSKDSGFFEINSIIKLNGKVITRADIEYRSFKDNIEIGKITSSNSDYIETSISKAWRAYENDWFSNINSLDGRLNNLKKILIEKFGKDKFNRKTISKDEFKEKMLNSNFFYKEGDLFFNAIGEIFYNYALDVQEKKIEVGSKNFNAKNLPKAPWTELNELFEDLNFSYRFKTNYFIKRTKINEQPKLFFIKEDGSLDYNQSRELKELSDGEKTIISLCFATLNGNFYEKSVLLLDEVDAVLNPSLISKFFKVIENFFIKKDVMVIMVTHSPATIAMSPAYTSYYELFKSEISENRILQVNKNDYQELKIANKNFYIKIENQSTRIKELETKINSDKDFLIITEGKTDWKYLIAALRFFHKQKKFLDINESDFYKFGSDKDHQKQICGTEAVNELSEKKLFNYLDSLIRARSIDINERNKKRIGIFDSDTKIKVSSQKDFGVHSFKIQPNNISTELLFNEIEIQNEINGKRLFIGKEFDKKSKRHLINHKLSLGGDNSNTNKAGREVIIDNSVFNEELKNVALSKEEFAQAIFKNLIKISSDSWENFRHIFQQISDFKKLTPKSKE